MCDCFELTTVCFWVGDAWCTSPFSNTKRKHKRSQWAYHAKVEFDSEWWKKCLLLEKLPQFVAISYNTSVQITLKVNFPQVSIFFSKYTNFSGRNSTVYSFSKMCWSCISHSCNGGEIWYSMLYWYRTCTLSFAHHCTSHSIAVTPQTYLSATASNLSGLNVPSLSMYMHFPSPPPLSIGSWEDRQMIQRELTDQEN